ncbi:MAG: flagellar biosynthesis protein FliQ [Acidobacteriota bacterium]
MSDELLIQMIRDTVWVVFVTAAPILGVALVVGMVISILQVVTSIQDTTFAFVPRMIAVCLVCLILLPWIIDRIVSFTMHLLSDFAPYAR